MDSCEKLTATENPDYLLSESSLTENNERSEDSKLKLEENYYEKLFIEEMNFRNNPNSNHMKNIIQKHCNAVEYFSSIGDNKRAMKYKLLNNIFLNDMQVIKTLDSENNNDIDDIKCQNSKYYFIKNILILNQKKNIDKYKNTQDFDDIKPKFNFKFNNEQEKFDELIKKKNNVENNVESLNLINDEINSQKNNFKKNLSLKLQKKKSLNENKILQGIQKVFINGKNIDDKSNNTIQEEEVELINHSTNENENDIEKKISPIKKDNNYSDKNTTLSNELKLSSNNNSNEINPLLSSANNKKTTSEFEPLTPFDSDKSQKNQDINEFKNSAKQDMSIISEEVNETNDFSLNNNETGNINNSIEDNISKKVTGISDQVEISLNETKYSNNSNTLSNCSLNNDNSLTKSIKSNESGNKILKSFRLDFNDLFEYIKEHQNTNKKTSSFCDDIKIIIENYIKDFNQYLSNNIINKIILKFSIIWEDMFNKYTEIAESFDKEIKELDFENLTKNKSDIKELNKLIDNINIEKENALNQNEEKYLSEIENNVLYFKKNFNKNDNGLLLLNEKFAYTITKRVCDMINNF